MGLTKMALPRALTVLVCVSFGCASVHGLTCLQCSNILQPRHCHSVVRCDADEVCFTRRLLVSQGYQLGCRKKNLCLGSPSPNATTCSECCSTDLCNAKACGEPGYPATRGPVCYDCDYHNEKNPCTNIDICSIEEECSILAKDEFGDRILTSGCKRRHVCPSTVGGPSSIIGRRSPLGVRSSSRILCNECCLKDLCNLNCATDHCSPSPCLHGTCSSDGFSYQCHCQAGWTGLHCDRNVNGCYSNPCQNGGTCTNGLNSYICQCLGGYIGTHCETDVNECSSNPCQNGGTCTDGVNYYICQCLVGYTGTHCETATDHCISSPCLHGSCTSNGLSYQCHCQVGWTGLNCNQTTRIGFDCLDVLNKNIGRTDGIYTIQLNRSRETLQVYCDMTTDGGGWTVFQKRFNGSVDFYRNFSQYEHGFGSVTGEFWLGLKYVYLFTANVFTDLRFDLGDASGNTAYQVYTNFSLSKSPNYTLHFGTSSGTANIDGSGGLAYNNGYRFSTFDREMSHTICAYFDHGAWWYNYCTFVNLNGKYVTPGTESDGFSHGESGVIFHPLKVQKSLKSTEMKFRRHSA